MMQGHRKTIARARLANGPGLVSTFQHRELPHLITGHNQANGVAPRNWSKKLAGNLEVAIQRKACCETTFVID